MFAIPTSTVGITQRVVATLVAVAVVLWTIGAYATAEAASYVDISDTLSDSDLNVTSAHTIAFTVPTASTLDAADTLTITFDSTLGGTGFTGVNTVVSGDLTVTIAGGGVTVDSFTAAADNLQISLDTTATAGQEVVVAIADGKITNPNAVGSATIDVSNGTDSAQTRVAIVDNVLVTAVVETVFDFTITGLATSSAVNGTTTTGSTTATLIDFGTLVAGQPEALAQRLNVTTNARSGFVVTVESDGDLASANGAVIDNFQNGSDVADTGTAWTAPTNNILDDTTWGHWGLTSSDSDLNSLGGFYSGEFGADEYIAASTTPREVFHHDGPSDGTTVDAGQADVLYYIQITALQEAADDYNTTLTYIATPTF